MPEPASASRSSTGESCLQGPHHSAHRSTTTGTSSERSRTSAWNISSLTSTTQRPAGPADPPGLVAGAVARVAAASERALHGGEIDRAGHGTAQGGGLGRLAGIGAWHPTILARRAGPDPGGRCGRPRHAVGAGSGRGRRPMGLSRRKESPVVMVRTSGATSAASRRRARRQGRPGAVRERVRGPLDLRPQRARPPASRPPRGEQPACGEAVQSLGPLLLGPAAARAHPLLIHGDVAGQQGAALHGIESGGNSAATCPSPRSSRSTVWACQRTRCGASGQGRAAFAAPSARPAVGAASAASRPAGGLRDGVRREHLGAQHRCRAASTAARRTGQVALRRGHGPRVGHRPGHEPRREVVEQRRDHLGRRGAQRGGSRREVAHPVAAGAELGARRLDSGAK